MRAQGCPGGDDSIRSSGLRNRARHSPRATLCLGCRFLTFFSFPISTIISACLPAVEPRAKHYTQAAWGGRGKETYRAHEPWGRPRKITSKPVRTLHAFIRAQLSTVAGKQSLNGLRKCSRKWPSCHLFYTLVRIKREARRGGGGGSFTCNRSVID